MESTGLMLVDFAEPGGWRPHEWEVDGPERS